MSKVFKPRRGSADQVAAFIGEANEVILNTTTNTLHVMDGLTPGGFPLAKEDDLNAFKVTQAAQDAEQDAAIAAAQSSADAAGDSAAVSFEVDGLDLVITYGNGNVERVKLPAGKSVGDMWWGIDPNSKPANVQVYSGQLLSRSAYPDHWGLVNGQRTVVSESEWQSMVSSQGFCPFYSSGDGSTTYRMPMVKGVHPKFVAALAEAGGYTAAGLPNITGSLLGDNNYGAVATRIFTTTGAYSTVRRGYGAGFDVGNDARDIYFDASISNSIYGASDTVQPPAVNVILGEYVVGSVAVVGEADAESLLASVTQLESGKADADVGGKGVVRSVNGVSADAAGNVDITSQIYNSTHIGIAEKNVAYKIPAGGTWKVASWNANASGGMDVVYIGTYTQAGGSTVTLGSRSLLIMTRIA